MEGATEDDGNGIDICEGVEGVTALSESQLSCWANAVDADAAGGDFISCWERRLIDLAACIVSCEDPDTELCVGQLDRRVETCPGLSESTQDVVDACL